MSVSPLRLGSHKSAPSRDPARQALADAIANADVWRKMADDARVAVERARGRLVAATTAHTSASVALAEARERAVAEVTQVETGQPSRLRALRQAEADAADDVGLVREGLQQAETQVEAAQAEVTHAERLVGAAADEVLCQGLDRQREEVLKLARAKLESVSVFEFMMSRGSEKSNNERWQKNTWFASHHNSVADIEIPNILRARAVAPWDAARAALLTDPTAPLPTIGG